MKKPAKHESIKFNMVIHFTCDKDKHEFKNSNLCTVCLNIIGPTKEILACQRYYEKSYLTEGMPVYEFTMYRETENPDTGINDVVYLEDGATPAFKDDGGE